MKLKLICPSADGNGIIAVKFQERTIVLQGVAKWPENRVSRVSEMASK